jgi:hypothetical protein
MKSGGRVITIVEPPVLRLFPRSGHLASRFGPSSNCSSKNSCSKMNFLCVTILHNTPQLNRLHEAYIVRGEDAPNVAVTAIPEQNKATLQILSMRPPFSRSQADLCGLAPCGTALLACQQRVVATVEDSVLRTEMASLESQEEDAPRRVLWFKPMSWLGQIRAHRASQR